MFRNMHEKNHVALTKSTAVRHRIAKLAAFAGALSTICGLAFVSGAIPAGASTTYLHGTAYYAAPLGSVNMQFAYYTTGSSVQSRYEYSTASGYETTVTWSGTTREWNGNLDFGFNVQYCIAPFNVGCVSGGYRLVISPAGHVVNQYSWGFDGSGWLTSLAYG